MYPSYKDNSTKDGRRRVLTDGEATSLFDGRQFRTFREFNIATATSLYFKIVVGADAILRNQEIDVDDGAVRFTTIASVPGNLVTETAPFSEILPVVSKNRMLRTPVTANSVIFSAGGTITGGLTIDIRRRRAGNAGNRATVGGNVADVRGVSPGTYYFRFENIDTGACLGTYSSWWETMPD